MRPRILTGFVRGLFKGAGKLAAGVVAGFALIGALAIIVVGLSNFQRVKWDAIGAALRGQSVSSEAVNARVNPTTQERHLTKAHIARSNINAVEPPVAQRASSTPHINALSDPPAALFSLPGSMPALPTFAPDRPQHPEHQPIPKQDPQQREVGVHVNLLASDTKQPDLENSTDVGVHVDLLPSTAPVTPHQAESTPSSVKPSSHAWRVVTVTEKGLVVAVGSTMRTIYVGQALPDGRILRMVNESSGTWAAANPLTPAVLPNLSQEKPDHGSPIPANPQQHRSGNASGITERQPVPGASAAR